MIHLFRWAGIALGIWMLRQAFLPALYRYRYRRPADAAITVETIE